ncbi:Putative Competence protein ComGF [Gracilibacillus orientalis]|uniref:Putative Competence protein ComGF n=1 Tax=Gracilibacillus orientalis TaxID=334253 RepID=A0A1I4KUB1_9BACI|nr:ComGF family competence protein [Gracilibacillus orientalis]SFL82384.1 Putative Competence protein ComGF [Gracilibacillus orientalis]
MLESLLTLLFLFILVSWYTQILLMWTHDEKEQLPMVYHFHHVIEFESQTALSIETKNNQLHFMQTNGDLVTISYHNDKIRRRVNSRGHEEILRNIKDFNLTDSGDDIAIELITDSGEQIEKILLKKAQE